MDYLKFLFSTVIATVLLVTEIESVGLNIGTYILLGSIWAYLVRYRPAAHAVAFTLWFGFIVLTYVAVQDAVMLNVVADPTMTVDHKDTEIGIGMFSGMVLFHPISYGLGLGIVFLFNILCRRFKRMRDRSKNPSI